MSGGAGSAGAGGGDSGWLANAMGLPLTDFGSAPTGKPGELDALKA